MNCYTKAFGLCALGCDTSKKNGQSEENCTILTPTDMRFYEAQEWCTANNASILTTVNLYRIVNDNKEMGDLVFWYAQHRKIDKNPLCAVWYSEADHFQCHLCYYKNMALCKYRVI
uniref:C-type lectin domain-containing protein n=1 Tax=Syphacia muris TaxID=451379 RepID=A0A0N5ANK2_9BILA